MNNYEAIKEMSLETLASMLNQISQCAKHPCELLFKFPDESDWVEYLKGDDMFLPFSKNRIDEDYTITFTQNSVDE